MRSIQWMWACKIAASLPCGTKNWRTHIDKALEMALPQEVVLQPCLRFQPLKVHKAQLQADRLWLVVLYKIQIRLKHQYLCCIEISDESLRYVEAQQGGVDSTNTFYCQFPEDYRIWWALWTSTFSKNLSLWQISRNKCSLNSGAKQCEDQNTQSAHQNDHA